MIDNGNENQTLTRRTLMLSGLGVGIFGALSARLYQLQVLKAQDYSALSEDNRFNFNIIVPSRGRIVDRSGDPLALNRQDYRVELIAERISDMNLTLDKIGEVIDLSDASRERIVKDVKKHAKFVPVLIEDHLSWEDFAALNIRAPELPGVVPRVGEGRSYPHEGVFCHILGQVGKAEQSDLDKDKDALLRQPTFRIGKSGVEKGADLRLRGKSGRLKVEVNAVGRIVREWPEEKNRAQSGDDVWLTLDAPLQKFAAEQFKDDSGGIAVIDVMTGELRTLLSMPFYNGNDLVSGISEQKYKELSSHPKKPFNNKAVKGNYPPASTFKMCVMLAALETGLVTPEEKVICTGHVTVGRKRFHCWHRRGGHGPVNLLQSLQYSCDVFYYEMAHRIGIDDVQSAAMRLGLGQSYDLGILAQSRGLIPSREWKQTNRGDGWRLGDSLNAFIGQGYVLATPLQLAVMTSRIANAGKAVTPHLIIGDEAPNFADLDVNPEHMEFIQQAMYNVCMVPGGTAYRHNPLGPSGVDMAGKTGTGQVTGISASERASGIVRNKDKEWRFRDHSIFVGYAPFDKPRFAVGTIVEHGGGGSGRAADITRQVLRRALERDGLIPPEPEASDDTAVNSEGTL